MWPEPETFPNRKEPEVITTSELMARVGAIVLTLPESKGPAEVINGSMIVYINNGIIRKKFEIPKTYEGTTIRCVPEKR